jgi:hypothetical protein
VPEPVRQPIAVAMQWVARIFAAALMMSLPGLGGQWLDHRWKTGFMGPAGFVVGLIAGMTYLIAATRSAEAQRKAAQHRPRVNDTNP